MIEFTVFGQPVAKGSTRSFPLMRDGKPVLGAGGRPVTITTNDNPKTKEWQLLISTAAQEHRPEPLYDGPVHVEMIFYIQRPESISVKKRPMPIVKPDIDKLIRACLDGLKGIIYTDDAKVVSLKAEKHYGSSGVKVLIEEVRPGNAEPSAEQGEQESLFFPSASVITNEGE